MVTGAHWIAQGQPLPLDADLSRWGWLALSGLIGFVLGDAALFQAFVLIGPRLSMLLMALSPVIGAVLAWLLLGVTLTGWEILGMALAIGGVAWVVTDRRNGYGNPDRAPRAYLIGVLFGLVGALGQAADGVIAAQRAFETGHPFVGAPFRLVGSVLRGVAWVKLRSPELCRGSRWESGTDPQP